MDINIRFEGSKDAILLKILLHSECLEEQLGDNGKVNKVNGKCTNSTPTSSFTPGTLNPFVMRDERE